MPMDMRDVGFLASLDRGRTVHTPDLFFALDLPKGQSKGKDSGVEAAKMMQMLTECDERWARMMDHQDRTAEQITAKIAELEQENDTLKREKEALSEEKVELESILEECEEKMPPLAAALKEKHTLAAQLLAEVAFLRHKAALADALIEKCRELEENVSQLRSTCFDLDDEVRRVTVVLLRERAASADRHDHECSAELRGIDESVDRVLLKEEKDEEAIAAAKDRHAAREQKRLKDQARWDDGGKVHYALWDDPSDRTYWVPLTGKKVTFKLTNPGSWDKAPIMELTEEEGCAMIEAKLLFAYGHFRYCMYAMVGSDRLVSKRLREAPLDRTVAEERRLIVLNYLVTQQMAKEFSTAATAAFAYTTVDVSCVDTYTFLCDADDSDEWERLRTVEKFHAGRMAKHNCNSGTEADTCHPVLAAFSHYTLEHTGYLCLDVQGWIEEDVAGAVFKAVLTDPAVQSEEKIFGDGDLHKISIAAFKEQHSCNEYCTALKLTPFFVPGATPGCPVDVAAPDDAAPAATPGKPADVVDGAPAGATAAPSDATIADAKAAGATTATPAGAKAATPATPATPAATPA
eukprot:CAMPEP_0114617012 /NCGR_PEP_ID=MMETSP0168-20121206/6979_1 /TAXON_ID=95228 ORGANISM="Vannella sp., Strain DIVA3 517/6/12" /NCGR_SAMPLE_ID=MMETSP0168 /ASSEMBLY_ACC=CAM_ASM_000044 /LENGTH=576 /DNA_ID=CAMNT_0001828137 /DNA_START=88 /DNA_END=1818 /DNA_ORIENTATION=-